MEYMAPGPSWLVSMAYPSSSRFTTQPIEPFTVGCPSEFHASHQRTNRLLAFILTRMVEIDEWCLRSR